MINSRDTKKSKTHRDKLEVKGGQKELKTTAWILA